MKVKKKSDWSVFSCLPEIHSLGVAIYDPIWSQRFHATPHAIELLHVLKGHLRLILSRRRLNAGPGDTLFVPTGVLHRDEFDLQGGLEIFMVQFRWEAERKFFRRVDICDMQTLPLPLKMEINMILDRMRSDISGGTEEDRTIAGVRLLMVLLLLLKAVEAHKAGTRVPGRDDLRSVRRRLLMARARQYLEQHFAEPVTLDHIAKTIGVSPFYLSHVFSEESDFSLFSYLTTLRMEKARALLAEGQSSVKQVAHAVGYDDPNYFSRVFHRYFGYTPRKTPLLWRNNKAKKSSK